MTQRICLLHDAPIRGAWPVYPTVVEKELARGRALDAIGFYLNGLMRPLLELIDMRYRPERYDFAWRYLHGDVPAEVERDLQNLAYVADADALRANLATLDRISALLFAEFGMAPLVALLSDRDKPAQ